MRVCVCAPEHLSGLRNQTLYLLEPCGSGFHTFGRTTDRNYPTTAQAAAATADKQDLAGEACVRFLDELMGCDFRHANFEDQGKTNDAFDLPWGNTSDTRGCGAYKGFDIISHRISSAFPALHHSSRGVRRALLGAHACGMLIGACDPML